MIRFPGLESIGWALLNSFWQFGLLTLCYLILTARDKRFTAAIRHNLAFVFSIFGTIWFMGDLFIGTSSFPSVAAVDVLTAQHSIFPPLRTPMMMLDQVVRLLPSVYLLLLLMRTGNAFLLSVLKKKSFDGMLDAGTGSNWFCFIEQCGRGMGIRRTVLLRWTAGPGMARTFGFLRPVILFPAALLTHLTAIEVEAILVHELAHIRRNDYLTHLWMSAFRFIFYFNPFAAFLFNTVSAERELACDDLVLGRSYPPAVYAQALVTLEQFRQDNTAMWLNASGQRSGQLADRVRRIAGLPVSRPAHGHVFRLLLTVLLIAFGLYSFRPYITYLKAGRTPASAMTDVSVAKPANLGGTPVIPASPPAAPVRIEPVSHEPVLAIRIDQKPGNPAEKTITGAAPAVDTDDVSLFSVPDSMPEVPVIADDADDRAYVSKKITRSFSYRIPETAPAPVPETENLQPYIPSSSFEYPLTDSVPVIALQSLQQNKTAVVELLAKWKALQMQQTLSRALEQRYLRLKTQSEQNLHLLPAKKDALKKSLQHLKEQMKIRKSELDRLSAILAEEPVIYM